VAPLPACSGAPVSGAPLLGKPSRAASGTAAVPRYRPRASLYTEEERRRRDATPWTLVQGILAPIQFAVFLVSLFLVIHYLVTGTGLAAATVSIVVKTLLLYAIMITGSIWEQRVFGQYLFARAFFWEDVFSMLVLALHTAYLGALAFGMAAPQLMILALAAYASYVINAAQFLLKLRAARRQAADIVPRTKASSAPLGAAGPSGESSVQVAS
jgi:3-vinyl bacteriochlorophyllide hydratase